METVRLSFRRKRHTKKPTTHTMGIQIGQIRAGQLATILVQGQHEMATGGRKGVPLNPLTGRVTRDHRITARVSGVET